MQFKQVVGQRELKQHLIHEVQSGKISHAKLFLGKLGYGSLPLALAYVQYILCENKQETDSCGVCPSCHKVNQLQHPDLNFIFPVVQAIEKKSDGLIKEWRELIQQNAYADLDQWTQFHDGGKRRKPIIGTEESQEIIKKLSYKSFEGGYKVMLIWLAEEMNVSCSNKILKILEEPPEKTLFLLLCDNQDQVLPTITSRTQLIKIPRIGLDDMVQYFQQVNKLSETVAVSISSQAEGDLNEGMLLSGVNDEKDENRELFIQMMRVCYKKDVIAMIDWAESLGSFSKERSKNFLKYTLYMFRQSILRNYTENQLTRTSVEEEAFLKNFARFISGNNIQDFMKDFNEAYYHIDRNANPRILFTELCFRVMRYIHHA